MRNRPNILPSPNQLQQFPRIPQHIFPSFFLRPSRINLFKQVPHISFISHLFKQVNSFIIFLPFPTHPHPLSYNIYSSPILLPSPRLPIRNTDKNERYQPPVLPGSVCGGALYLRRMHLKKGSCILLFLFPSSAAALSGAV